MKQKITRAERAARKYATAKGPRGDKTVYVDGMDEAAFIAGAKFATRQAVASIKHSMRLSTDRDDVGKVRVEDVRNAIKERAKEKI